MESLHKVLKRLKWQHKVSPTIASKTFNKGFKILHSLDGNKRRPAATTSSELAAGSEVVDLHAAPSQIKRLRFHDVKRKFHSIQPKLISMYDIVEDCDRFKEDRFKQNYIGKLLNSKIFKIFIIAAILLNSIVITIQTDRNLETKFRTLFTVLDRMFLLVFVLEILLKWYYDFYTFWRIGWNVFDFLIVVASLFGPDLAIANNGRVLRILVVFRALRILLSISTLRGVQVIVHTIVHSLPDMTNIVALLFISMFIFAVISVSFFGESCPKHFGTLGKALFSLFICVTQDGWVRVNDDLKACGKDIAGPIFLTLFIMIGAFVFANLVVAVVVINLEWSIAEQKELRKKYRKLKNDGMSNTLKTDDVSVLLKLMIHSQEPLLIPDITPSVKALEVYCLIMMQIEENIVQFTQIKEKITEILAEEKVLAQLDEAASNDIIIRDDDRNIDSSKSSASKQFKFDTLRLPLHQNHRKRSAISELTQHTVGIHHSSSVF